VTCIRVNGQPSTTLPVLDRGLQYGDGLFETIAIRQGRARLLDYHLERLYAGCARLGIPPPAAALLKTEIAAVSAVVAGSLAATATVKLIVTRGAGPRGYRPPAAAQPTCIVIGEAVTGRRRHRQSRCGCAPRAWAATRRWQASSTCVASSRCWRGPSGMMRRSTRA
jgi:branched-subunit amino acid aminotransferase/4-amino-4-deoxychorismate lyase